MRTYSFTAFVRHNDRAFSVELMVQAETLMQAFEEAKKEFALRYSFFEIISFCFIED